MGSHQARKAKKQLSNIAGLRNQRSKKYHRRISDKSMQVWHEKTALYQARMPETSEGKYLQGVCIRLLGPVERRLESGEKFEGSEEFVSYLKAGATSEDDTVAGPNALPEDAKNLFLRLLKDDEKKYDLAEHEHRLEYSVNPAYAAWADTQDRIREQAITIRENDIEIRRLQTIVENQQRQYLDLAQQFRDQAPPIQSIETDFHPPPSRALDSESVDSGSGVRLYGPPIHLPGHTATPVNVWSSDPARAIS